MKQSVSETTRTLRARGTRIAWAGFATAATAGMIANPQLAYSASLDYHFNSWPWAAPQIASIVTAAACLLTVLIIRLGRERSTFRSWVTFFGLAIAVEAIVWRTDDPHDLCFDSLCTGWVAGVANWWIFWGLTLLAMALAGTALRAADGDL